MAFIKGIDTFDPTQLGKEGSAVIGAERHVYFNENADIASFNIVDNPQEWARIFHLESYDATDNTNKIEVFDGKLQTETKEGKVSSELKLAQTYKGWLNSIGKLKGKQLWFAECITDDRQPVGTDGKPNYFEISLVNGKLTNITTEKGDAEAIYKINGEGAYNVDTQRKIFAGITPVAVTATAPASADGSDKATVTLTGKDFKNASINLTDLTVVDLMGEISSISVEWVSGPTISSQVAGANDNEVSCTFNGAGDAIVKGKIVTKNGGVFYSNTVTISVS